MQQSARCDKFEYAMRHKINTDQHPKRDKQYEKSEQKARSFAYQLRDANQVD